MHAPCCNLIICISYESYIIVNLPRKQPNYPFFQEKTAISASSGRHQRRWWKVKVKLKEKTILNCSSFISYHWQISLIHQQEVMFYWIMLLLSILMTTHQHDSHPHFCQHDQFTKMINLALFVSITIGMISMMIITTSFVSRKNGSSCRQRECYRLPVHR